MTTPLTERYVAATLQRVPAGQRDDIAAELRASILDSIEAKTAAGLESAEAEREVLTELGDPERLAADYAERPLHLIGPRLYLRWWRVLKLLMIIPVIVTIIDVTATATSGAGIGEILLSGLGTAFGVALHVFFWVTLTFALIERYDPRESERLGSWDLDDLPEQPAQGKLDGDIVPNVVFSVFFIAVLALGGRSFMTFGGDDPIAVIDPALWSLWLPVLIGVLALGIVMEFVRLAVGQWTYPLAGANLFVGLAFAIPACWLLLTDRFLNPEFITLIEQQTGTDAWVQPSLALAALSVIAITAWDTADAFVKAQRASRAVAA